MKKWLEENEYRQIQQSMPITAIDILPIKRDKERTNTLDAIGLIKRETADQGVKWCIVGGRLIYGDDFPKGIRRQIRETLGDKVKIVSKIKDQQPLFVAQYFPTGKSPFLRDPRQHAVGLTYAVELSGEVVPQGEAIEFRWFKLENIPEKSDFGFDQDKLVNLLLQRLK